MWVYRVLRGAGEKEAREGEGELQQFQYETYILTTVHSHVRECTETWPESERKSDTGLPQFSIWCLVWHYCRMLENKT